MRKPDSGPFHMALAAANSLGPPQAGKISVPVFSHGSLEVEYYAPQEFDTQQPHSRDEVYVVAQGDGVFHDGETRESVTAGSMIFVPAGREHRFEDFSADFGVWVVFYGPEGGESLKP